MTGTLSITASLAAVPASAGQLPVILLALALIFTGIGFKLSIVPFHLWTPDVYQGAPAPVTAFLSTGSKVALFAATLRFALAAAPPVWDYAWPVLWGLALLTMAVGNLTALYQTQVKRLLAYSSIAQMGYLLMTLLAVKDGGAPAVMFYLVVYAVMDLGAFGIVGTFSGGDTDREELSDYQGLGYSHPWRAGLLAVCLLSLAGLPPTAGFMAKLVIFQAVLQANFIILAVLGIATVIVSIYYYINVVVHLYMHEKGDSPAVPGDRPGHRSGRGPDPGGDLVAGDHARILVERDLVYRASPAETGLSLDPGTGVRKIISDKTPSRGHSHLIFSRYREKVDHQTVEVISKPISGVILPQPEELKLGKNHPPFLKGGRGD